MTAIDYAALVERLRDPLNQPLIETMNEAADAIERLTKPVGVEPDSYEIWVDWDYPSHWDSCDKEAYGRAAENDRRVIYSAETVARLIAERNDAQNKLNAAAYEIQGLQDLVKLLRDLVRNSTEYRLGVPAYESAARPIPAAQAVPEGLAASFDDAVEAARLLGGKQAKKGFGAYTEQDSRFERSMYESIAKHRRAMLAAAPQPPAEHVPAATPSEDAKDAARYRWIVGEHDVDLPVVRCSWKRHSDRKGGEWVNLIDGEDMTEHIDAAMRKGGA